MLTKKLVITFEETDGGLSCDVINKGFTAIEILGLLEARKFDVQEQIHHRTHYNRTVINADGTKTVIEDKTTEE